MINIVLYQPEIPPNTGNIVRLCANSGAALHLIHPLGFVWEDKRLARSGLDYHEFASVTHYDNWENFFAAKRNRRIFAFSTKGSRRYDQVQFSKEDYLLFGPESRGLPEPILQAIGLQNCLRCPMLAHSRSLNLANTVSIALYEAWRQLDFFGAE